MKPAAGVVVARLREDKCVTLRSLLSAVRSYAPEFWRSYRLFEPAVLVVSGCVKTGGLFWPKDDADQMAADMLEALDSVSPEGCIFTLVDDKYGWHPVEAVQPTLFGESQDGQAR